MTRHETFAAAFEEFIALSDPSDNTVAIRTFLWDNYAAAKDLAAITDALPKGLDDWPAAMFHLYKVLEEGPLGQFAGWFARHETGSLRLAGIALETAGTPRSGCSTDALLMAEIREAGEEGRYGPIGNFHWVPGLHYLMQRSLLRLVASPMTTDEVLTFTANPVNPGWTLERLRQMPRVLTFECPD